MAQQPVNVLLVGAGRMGIRHLRGLAEGGATANVVDPRADARSAITGAATYASVEEALAAGDYDAAVLAETAAGRLERFQRIAEAGIPRVLVEKPIEQSRTRTHAIVDVARRLGTDARVNHFYRTLPLFEELRRAGGPFHLSVTGGAFGLACNGIHWIDLAVWLSGGADGSLLHGELDDVVIESGRGPGFRDFGGRALFGFADGTRLFLDSVAASSAPMRVVITQRTRQTVIDPLELRTTVIERDPASTLPPYRYGADYHAHDSDPIQGEELWRSTTRWLAGGSHATLDESARSHDLLFDLLETGGQREFAIT